MVATVIEKMLSTALYWKTESDGMAAASMVAQIIYFPP
jgi:hypothetical protein